MPMVAPWHGDGCLRFQIAGQVLPSLVRCIVATQASPNHCLNKDRSAWRLAVMITIAAAPCSLLRPARVRSESQAVGTQPAMSSLESTRRCANPALCSDRVGATLEEVFILVADPVSFARDAPYELEWLFLRKDGVIVEKRNRHRVAFI